MNEDQRARRTWAGRLWRVPVVVVLFLIGGGVYLARAKPIYSAEALLQVREPDGSPLDQIKAAAGAVDDPTGKLKTDLRVQAVPESRLIRVTLDGDDPRLTAQLVNRVINAYASNTSAATLPAVDPPAPNLNAQQQNARAALEAFKRNNPDVSPDQEKNAKDRLAALSSAVTAAQIEAASAKAQLDATLPMLADPSKARDLIEANRSKGIFDSLDRETRQLDSDLTAAKEQLEQQKKTMLAQNPIRVASENAVAQLQDQSSAQRKRYVEVYRTVLEQQYQSALRRQEDLQRLLDAQRQDLHALQAKMARLDELAAKVNPAPAARPGSDVTGEIERVRIVQAAAAPTRPTWPDRTRILWTALACGVIAGLMASLIPAGEA